MIFLIFLDGPFPFERVPVESPATGYETLDRVPILFLVIPSWPWGERKQIYLVLAKCWDLQFGLFFVVAAVAAVAAVLQFLVRFAEAGNPASTPDPHRTPV